LGKGTAGKIVTGVRVYDINLNPAPPARIVARSLELITWVIFFGLLFAFFQSYYIDKIGQGLGDYISKTYVIQTKEVAALPPRPA
jgi:uncharacterized RDD family membrane protein YckC